MKFNFIKIAVVLTISLIFSSQSYGSKYENCKDLRIIEDTRKLKTDEYKHDDISEKFSYDTVTIFNKYGRFRIKKYKIHFRKLGDTRLWKKTGSFKESLAINKGFPKYVYISKDTTEIVEVNVWGLPYDKCFAYYTNQELRNIEIAKEKERKEKKRQRRLELERRAVEADLKRQKEKKRKLKEAKLAEKRRIERLKYEKYEKKREEINKQIGKIEGKSIIYYETKRRVIYENCVIDKLKPNSQKSLEEVILSNCKRVSHNPNLWERFWYDKYNEVEPPKRGYLGVKTMGLDKELQKIFNMKPEHGAIITSVDKGMSAEKAGLKSGDLLVKFNNVVIDEYLSLSLMIAKTPAGSKVPIEIIRGKDKDKLTLFVTLSTRVDYK